MDKEYKESNEITFNVEKRKKMEKSLEKKFQKNNIIFFSRNRIYEFHSILRIK